MLEVNEAAAIISDAVDPEANIIFGAVIDEAFQDEVRVTVIATGFDGKPTNVQTGKSGSSIIEPFKVRDLDIPAWMRR